MCGRRWRSTSSSSLTTKGLSSFSPLFPRRNPTGLSSTSQACCSCPASRQPSGMTASALCSALLSCLLAQLESQARQVSRFSSPSADALPATYSRGCISCPCPSFSFLYAELPHHHPGGLRDRLACSLLRLARRLGAARGAFRLLLSWCLPHVLLLLTLTCPLVSVDLPIPHEELGVFVQGSNLLLLPSSRSSCCI